eukprot:1466217-Amphidinium_carterae.1
MMTSGTFARRFPCLHRWTCLANRDRCRENGLHTFSLSMTRVCYIVQSLQHSVAIEDEWSLAIANTGNGHALSCQYLNIRHQDTVVTETITSKIPILRN